VAPPVPKTKYAKSVKNLVVGSGIAFADRGTR
jgi:hypothetical protein